MTRHSFTAERRWLRPVNGATGIHSLDRYTSTHSLYSLLCWTGSQCSESRIVAVMRSYFRLQRMSRAAALSTLQGPYVNSTGAVQDAVALIYATCDKCMYHRLGSLLSQWLPYDPHLSQMVETSAWQTTYDRRTCATVPLPCPLPKLRWANLFLYASYLSCQQNCGKTHYAAN